MLPRSLRSKLSMLGIGAAMLVATHLALAAQAVSAPRFHLEEATIADVHRALRAKEITAEQLVQLYFKRIEAYNGTCVKGEIDPATGLMFGEITPVENAGQVNAYMTLNIRGKRSKTDPVDDDPKMLDALETARVQDAHFARSGNFVGPLHGIPIAIKDNYDTVDMRTTAGAIADYADDKPPKDATMVAKLRAAGAILLGKTNLDEYAPAGIGRSTLGGQTCNPYDTKRITGGSSAGSAAAVAANLAICALGTDTSGSVRYPSSLNALVGIVATQGLVSRAGIVPLTFSRDRGGPMCRTVEDTAAMLEVLTGDDPRDAITAVAHGRPSVVYSNYAGRHSLAGKRLGVVRDFMIEASIADRENVRIGNEALADMRSLGATLIDPVDFSRAIAEIMTAYEPGFFTRTFPAAIPAGVKAIDHLAAIASDPKLLPGGARGVNLRMLAPSNPRIEARYALDLYFKERGDKKIPQRRRFVQDEVFCRRERLVAICARCQGGNARYAGRGQSHAAHHQPAAHHLQGNGGQQSRCPRLCLHHDPGAARLSEPGRRGVRLPRRAARAQGKDEDVRSQSPAGRAQSQIRPGHLAERRRQLCGQSERGERPAGDRGAGRLHPRGL